MAVSKVIYGGDTIVDLTADTVTAETLADGVTAHGANGESIVGTMRRGEDLEAVLTEQEELIATLQDTLRQKTEGSGGTDTRFVELVTGAITTIDDSEVTVFRPYAFHTCTNLVTARFSKVTTSATSIFRECSNLQSVDLPELGGTIGGSIFTNCSSLTYVNIPKVTLINTYAFQNCSALTRLELGNVSTISAGAFKDSGLETLIIRRGGTAITTIANTNVFDGTPIASGAGYIYVPSSLVDKFKSATNWSTYAAQIRAIEDYPEICGGES